MHFPKRLRPLGIVRRLGKWSCALSIAAGIGFLGLSQGTATAQQQGPLSAPTQLKRKPASNSTPSHPNARMDVNMVLVPVTVTDLKDRPVTDLKPNSFKVFEDGIEQTVVSLHRE